MLPQQRFWTESSIVASKPLIHKPARFHLPYLNVIAPACWSKCSGLEHISFISLNLYICKITCYRVMYGKREIDSDISDRLESTNPNAKMAYVGAVCAFNVEEYDEKPVCIAHLLRESIDLLAKESIKRNPEIKTKIKSGPGAKARLRLLALEKLTDQSDESLRSCQNLAVMYKALSKTAHHCTRPSKTAARHYFNSMLDCAERDMRVMFGIKSPNGGAE